MCVKPFQQKIADDKAAHSYTIIVRHCRQSYVNFRVFYKRFLIRNVQFILLLIHVIHRFYGETAV